MSRLQAKQHNHTTPRLVEGTIAGVLATFPMTLFLFLIHRLLPKWQRYALPPERITKELADRSQIIHNMNKQQLLAVTLFTHFGYGGVSGALYAFTMERLPLARTVKGILFGILVWAISYLGWQPLFHFREQAPREPLRRNGMMIAAHFIFGISTALLTGRVPFEQQQQA